MERLQIDLKHKNNKIVGIDNNQERLKQAINNNRLKIYLLFWRYRK